MTEKASRKYIKTKFEGVFYRLSTKRDPRTGEFDRVYCFWYADAEGKGHWKSVGRHSQGERPATARQARMKFLAEMAGGRNPAVREKVTVGDAVDAYIEWARAEKKHIDIPARQYAKHLRPRVHALPILSLTPGLLTSLKAQLAATPKAVPQSQKAKVGVAPGPVQYLSDQTVHHLFSFLRRAINRAIATGLWDGVNPVESKRSGAWKMPKVDNKALRFLSPAEAAGLLDALGVLSRPLHDMAYLSLKTGLRATEIFKLRVQDVDVHAGILHVTSKGGRRDPVHATADVIEMLREYMEPGGGFLFPGRGDEPIKSTSSTFARAVQALELAPKDGDRRYAVTFHTLRHTFASWLAQSGKVSLLELKALLRHESLAMTQRYAHLIPGQEREKLSIIDTVLGSVKEHD